MSTTLQALSIKRKITALFADGSSKQNLGIPSVVELLDGAPNCPVTVSEDAPEASQILEDLAAQANRKVVCAPDGLLLALPAVEPPVAEPVNSPIPRTRRGDIPASKEPKFERKYAQLASIFFNGSVKGQILSVFKTRVTNPAKVEDYKAALAAGMSILGSNP